MLCCNVNYEFNFQDTALTVTESTVKMLINLANNDEGFKNVKSAATNVLGTLGNMNDDGSAEDSGSFSENKTITAVCTLNYV